MNAEQRIKKLLLITAQEKASDLHLSVARYPTLRIDGKLIPVPQEEILTNDDIKEMCEVILDEEKKKIFMDDGQVDFSYSLEDKVRFRVNAFFQQGNVSLAFRLIPRQIKNLEELNVPKNLYDFTKVSQGLVLIVGPTGHGKSTTLAALINEINKTQEKNIITIEDPIEYIYEQDRSIINQREILQDAKSFHSALKAVFRQDANVVLIGEMRDLDTISTALTAAETGHLILATLHTNDSPQTIDRIIDVFPAHQQSQVRSQLANVLVAVISQRLVPKIGEGRVPAVEIMIKNHAVENLIRENKLYQIDNVIETGSEEGMVTMDKSLVNLVKQGIVSPEVALSYAKDQNNFETLLKN